MQSWGISLKSLEKKDSLDYGQNQNLFFKHLPTQKQKL